MRLIDADALEYPIHSPAELNAPTVRCEDCAQFPDCAIPHSYTGYWTGGGTFPGGCVACAHFERRQS